MAHHIWSVLCTSSSIDADSRQISLFDVVEVLNLRGKRAKQAAGENLPDVAELKLIPQKLHFVSLFCRSETDVPERPEVRVLLRCPDGEELTPAERNRLDLRNYQRVRQRLLVNGLPFHGLGRYWWVVQQKSEKGRWTTLARVPLDLGINEEEASS